MGLAPPAAAAAAPPVLCVHGIDDTSQTIAPVVRALHTAGWSDVTACDMVPSNGDAGIAVLAGQVQMAATALRQRTGAAQIDVVAFSMGALVTRYWLQRLGGQAEVRRFVSISGPHHGTWTGYARWNSGGGDMRPDSALLQDLARDPLPWGAVQVFTLWTPFDLMVVPASSGRLDGATERIIPVLVHPWMLWDGRVHAAIIAALRSPVPDVAPVAH
ncbi:MAG: lipase [Candidatus Sericytochromatia bacterium]|nr:lipase [Candidatus Sericytochromatia bacterium]